MSILKTILNWIDIPYLNLLIKYWWIKLKYCWTWKLPVAAETNLLLDFVIVFGPLSMLYSYLLKVSVYTDTPIQIDFFILVTNLISIIFHNSTIEETITITLLLMLKKLCTAIEFNSQRSWLRVIFMLERSNRLGCGSVWVIFPLSWAASTDLHMFVMTMFI